MSTKIRILFLGIIIITAIAAGCNTVNPTRLNYTLPPSQLANMSWDEILTSPSKIDSFNVLNTGAVKVPLDGMLNIDKLKVANADTLDKQLWVDVFVFLFHHKEKGWFMIDTGLDSTFQNKGNIKGLMAGKFIKETRQQRGQNIAAQLKRENKHIQGIFITHLHADHTSGLPELDRSLPKYVAKGEEFHHIPMLYYSNHLTDYDQLFELDWTKGVNKFPFSSVMDIFGDGSFLGIHTPGHSNNHLSYLLMTTQGALLLMGDASHTKYGFTNKIEPGWVEDRAAAERSVEQLVKFHEMNPQVKMMYGHER